MISFFLPEHQFAEISLFSLSGRKIKILAAGILPKGVRNIRLDGRDLKSGSYIVSLKAGTEILSRKMVLIK